MQHVSPIPHFTAQGTASRAQALPVLLWIEAMFRTLRERRALMRLDDRGLKDIGLSRADADREGSRPFWDVPG